MRVTTLSAQKTTTGVKGALDVPVTVSVNGLDCDGRVTLVHDAINGGWCAYGDSADHWVSGALLTWLQALDEGEDLSDMLHMIETYAAVECDK